MKNGQRNDYINWVLTEMIEYLAYQLVVDKSSASVDAKVEAKNLFNATKDDKKELGLVRKGFEGTTFQSGITQDSAFYFRLVPAERLNRNWARFNSTNLWL